MRSLFCVLSNKTNCNLSQPREPGLQVHTRREDAMQERSVSMVKVRRQLFCDQHQQVKWPMPNAHSLTRVPAPCPCAHAYTGACPSAFTHVSTHFVPTPMRAHVHPGGKR